jgi:hypothetical protein
MDDDMMENDPMNDTLDIPMEPKETFKEDINVKVKDNIKTEVIGWVTNNIDAALRDRSEREERWMKWIKQYEEILPKTKSFPWKNCSNISVPVTPIAVETIHAREVNTLFAVRPYINVKPKKRSADRNNCFFIENFFDQIQQNVLDLYGKGSEWLLEKNKMGTGWLKVYWNYDKKKRPDDTFKITDDCKIDVVMLEDMIYPANAVNEQTCSFLAQRIRTDWTKLKAKGAIGIYKDVDKIKSFMESTTVTKESGKDIQKTKDEIENLTRNDPQTFEEYVIYEVYFDYDIDDDGFAEPTVMTLHKDSGTVLRWIRHPYEHGLRPFVVNKYMMRSGRIEGKGIAEMSEYLQEATNTTFNQTLDNMTLANAKVFKARKQSKDDIPKDGIYPGLTLYLDDPATDLMEFQMGDVKASNFNLIQMLRDYHERRTKVTDYSLGRESSSLKSRATATGTLALLQESGRHFDLVINNSRNALVEVAYQVIELYMQYSPNKIIEVVGNKEGDEADVFLPLGLGNLRENYEFYCTATSLTVNKEIEKQTNLIMIQQLGGLFNQMIQLLMMVNNPQAQLPPDIINFVHGVLRSYFAMAEDLVKSFEKIDISSYLPELPDVVKNAYGQGLTMQDMLSQMGGMMNGQGNSPEMAGYGQPGVMEGLFAPGTGAGEQGTSSSLSAGPEQRVL